MLANQYIAHLEELIGTYGDHELWVGSDDEGNSYVRPYEPSIGYVVVGDEDNHTLDGGELTTSESDIEETWQDEYDEKEPPTKEQLKEFIDSNYVMVFVS